MVGIISFYSTLQCIFFKIIIHCVNARHRNWNDVRCALSPSYWWNSVGFAQSVPTVYRQYVIPPRQELLDMACLVAVCRDGEEDFPFLARQIPLYIDDTLTVNQFIYFYRLVQVAVVRFFFVRLCNHILSWKKLAMSTRKLGSKCFINVELLSEMWLPVTRPLQQASVSKLTQLARFSNRLSSQQCLLARFMSK